PLLPADELQRLGFAIAAYPLTLLQAMVTAVETALAELASGHHPAGLLDFEHIKEVLGFPEYYREETRYAQRNDQD
ncbi:MAG: carboxyvinyl-carboxyphosphonate phosphorylmutase, partial [Desulfofustis sp.]|nr:carboxyvinyl-carboxyphosphonate phosphorylmutase [Desulfofustis sp.]